MPREILQEELRLTSNTKKYQAKRLKDSLSQESELCYVKMRENILNLYHPMTFNLKIRSLRQPTRLTTKIHTVFTLTAK